METLAMEENNIQNNSYQSPQGGGISAGVGIQSGNDDQPQEWNDDQSAMFVCRLCNKTFYNAIALRNHMNLHHELTDGSRNEQDSVFVYRNDDSNKSINGLCTFKFFPLKNQTEDETNIHDGLVTRVFSEDTTYIVVKLESDEADVDAAKRRRLEGVVKRTQIKPQQPTVDLRGPFTCTFPLPMRPELQCRQIFFNCCEYSMHYREDHTKRRKAALRCQVCERRLDRDLLPAPQPAAAVTFSCRMCGQMFLSASEYDDHNRLLHGKLKPHQCQLCAKRFTQQGGLQQHMRMHTGIRPFGCHYCPKAFTQKAGLDQHLRTHTKIKPFKCVICTKGFSQSVHLRQHMRTHTNIQPFECYECGKRFKQTSHLNFHLRSHGGGGGGDALAGAAAAGGSGGQGEEGAGGRAGADQLYYDEEYVRELGAPGPAGYTFTLHPQQPTVDYILHYN